MNTEQAKSLIEGAILPADLVWADLGAGSGTFTFALNELLGFDGTIYAIDQRLDLLRDKLKTTYIRSTVHLYEKSFIETMEFLPALDGVLLANAIHYVSDAENFIRNLVDQYLKSTGILLIIEYDRHEANSYVPYPFPLVQFERICSNLGFPLPEEIGRRPSIYGGHEIYAGAVRPRM